MKRRAGTMAVALMAVVILAAGCGYPGDARDRAATAGQRTVTVTTAPPSGGPQTGTGSPTLGTTSSPSPGTGSQTGVGTTAPRPEGKRLDLKTDHGRLYLLAVQAFSPELERWVVDLNAKTIEFSKYNCAGRKLASVKSVSVEPTTVTQPQPGVTVVTATWPSGNANPLYPLSASPTTDFEIRDGYLTPRFSLDAATTDAEVATSAFLSGCKDVAGAISGFVL